MVSVLALGLLAVGCGEPGPSCSERGGVETVEYVYGLYPQIGIGMDGKTSVQMVWSYQPVFTCEVPG